ncbi:MAG: hypothetical protein J1E57_06695 [Prevotella sp.]|nr:hypothetical protein [Prevotella sp.]
MPGISQQMLHSDIRDDCNDLPNKERQGIADFAAMLVDSALFLGKDSARELALIFARHVADYPQELAQPLKQLINGMGEMENRARERTSINIGQAQDIVTDGGTKNVRNININNDIKE